MVGRGGFGTVYRARMLGQDGFTRPVALKVLNDAVAHDQDFAERLRDEARLLGLLQHRGIVWVDGLMQLDGRWTIVMEYVEGVNLKQLLSAMGPVPLACALEMVRRVAEAFQYAYESPTEDGRVLCLLHRDLKPSNIHLTPSGDVKVLDFGVARAEFQSREAVTRSLVLGSLEYMAPERLDGIDTHAGDVYALGVVFFELLTDQLFGRTSGNRERHLAHLSARLEVLRAACGDEEVCALVEDCLTYDVEARPTAALVAQRARDLCARYPEPWLVDWAASVVPVVRQSLPPVEGNDPLSGSTLIEGPARERPSTTASRRASPPQRSWRVLVSVLLAAAGLGLLGATALSAAVGLWWWFSIPVPPPPQPPPMAAPPLPALPPPDGLPGTTAEETVAAPVTEAATLSEDAPDVSAEVVPSAGEVVVDEPPPQVVPSPSSKERGRGGGMGSVVVQGAVADVRLEDASGRGYGRGEVPAGTYGVSVSFDGTTYHDAGRVTVHAAEQVVLVCRANLKRCVAR